MDVVQFSSDHPSHVSETLKRAIDDYCIEIYNDEPHRNHLGASLIGHECSRYLWYNFRWVKREYVPARNGRLFNRGHREEQRMIEFLQGIGFKVRSHDEQGKQLRISSCGGHFGGSQDAELIHPQLGTGLGEFKTSGTGRKFSEIVEKGVKLAKPQHWAQMCTYGRARGYTWAIYMCANKNDDDLHVEYVKLDWNAGLHAEQRANDIITAQLPPEKCTSSPAYWLCKSCPFKGPCWQGEAFEKNCRSCVNAIPVDGAQWVCKLVNQVIPGHVIPVGCDAWQQLA